MAIVEDGKLRGLSPEGLQVAMNSQTRDDDDTFWETSKVRANPGLPCRKASACREKPGGS